MAVDEALCNIHRHGYKGEYGKAKLHVTTHTSPSPKIDVTIHDEANQVNTSHIKSRDLDEVRPGGLGVHLIQTIMDEATWTKRDPCGMTLTMSKTNTTSARQQPLTNSNND
jgi:anti-sigma regulatory factor (Ser/Thr protein kinase)